MSKILVTGASGFIGSNLVEALAGRGETVRGLARTSASVDHLQRLGMETVAGDVLDLESLRRAVQGCEVVYHLAGLTHALQTERLDQVNGHGSENVARACAEQANPPTLVLVSSVAAAGPSPRGQTRTENEPPSPISKYGRSKRAGEIAVTNFADRLPITIVRPGAVFGPRDREMLAVFKTIRQVRCHPLPGLTSPPLSLIYVADLVEILIRAAQRGRRIEAPHDGQAGGVGPGHYFGCVDEYPTYADFGRMVRKTIRRPFAPVLPMPMPLPWLLAGANELRCRLRGRSEAFNLDKIREATATSWACSPLATYNDLDFRPPKPLAERIAETAEWYLREKWI